MTILWTKPHYGVQHTVGTPITRANWCTVEDHKTFANLLRWFPGCGFSPLRSQHNTADEARTVAEQWLTWKSE